jgi:hypothetical protein
VSTAFLIPDSGKLSTDDFDHCHKATVTKLFLYGQNLHGLISKKLAFDFYVAARRSRCPPSFPEGRVRND